MSEDVSTPAQRPTLTAPARAGARDVRARTEGDVDAIPHEGSGIDWFEFDVGISVDGQRINLLPQISDLLKAVPDDADSDFFDLEDGDRQTLFVALDDGRLLPLPYALPRVLKPSFSPFRSTRNSSCSAARIGCRLEELIAGAGIAWSGGEALRILGRPAPEGFAATLRPYQGQGYSWLRFLGETGLGGVLADDIGLGKRCRRLRTFSPRSGSAASTARAWWSRRHH